MSADGKFWLLPLAGVASLFSVSCGSGAEVEAIQEAADPAQIHRDEQQVVADCMRKEGFEYRQIPFVSSGATSNPRTYVELSMADDIGYSAVFAAIVGATTPRGEPVEGLAEAEIEAYDDALFGRDFDGGDGELGGCLLVGSDAVGLAREGSATTDWKLHENEEKSNEFMLELTSSPEYEEFSSMWQSCMANRGFEVEVGPFDLENPIQLEIFFDALEIVDEWIAASGGPVGPVVDRVTFDLALEENHQLRALYNREIELARADRLCRMESWETISLVLEELSIEIFGIPFEEI